MIKTSIKNIFFNFILIIVSIFFTLILIELALRTFYPKYQYVAESSFKKDADRIWSRKPYYQYDIKHPDTKKPHTVYYNNFALRQNRNFNAKEITSSINIGFFGDSFLENLRMPAQYSFTEPLEYILNRHTKQSINVLNFGIGGYGTGQSYLYYHTFKYIENLDYVFYLFCANDLRNIYENNIFTIKDNQLIQNQIKPSAWWISFLNKFHTTYLVMDLVQQVNIKLFGENKKIYLGKEAHTRQKKEQYLLQYKQKKRLHNATAMEIENAFITGENTDNLNKSMVIFKTLLHKWRQEVESNGGKFYVVLLPRLDEHKLYQTIANDFNVIDLYTLFHTRIDHYDYSNWRFKNDAHWNENANFLTSKFLYHTLEKVLSLPSINSSTLEKDLYTYYSSFSQWLPDNLSTQQIKINHQEQQNIKNRYMLIPKNNN